MPVLATDRLLLRHWTAADLAPFAELNADPVVMEHFASTLSREASDALAGRIAAALDERGWGLWAVEVRGPRAFAGFVGLSPVGFDVPFGPAVEVGWRLARRWWGRGLATEAAKAVRDHALAGDGLGLAEVVSFTAATNAASQRVMEKIGMTHDPADDFDHPTLPEGHRLRRHVLYRVSTPTVTEP